MILQDPNFAKLHFSTPGFNPKSPCLVGRVSGLRLLFFDNFENSVVKFLQPTNQQDFFHKKSLKFPNNPPILGERNSLFFLFFQCSNDSCLPTKIPFEPIPVNQASQNEAPCRDHVRGCFGVPRQPHGFRILRMGSLFWHPSKAEEFDV